ncbi:manganese-repressed peroxidase [Mycena amicta]|nr:manganese-repressed peroxidase [Mycena amicta]
MRLSFPTIVLFSAVFSLTPVFAAVPKRLWPWTSYTPHAVCSKGRTTVQQSCCVWYDVMDDIQKNLFAGGTCNRKVEQRLLLTFHDAIGISSKYLDVSSGGGAGAPLSSLNGDSKLLRADGSIIQHSDVETTYIANKGLIPIINQQRVVAISHKVSFADIIQFAGAIGLSNCPGSPRLEFLAGRHNNSIGPSPNGLIPGPADNVTATIARFADAGLSVSEMVDLLASHSVAAQHSLDASIPGAPLDSTPGTFDSQFFVETLLKGTLFPGTGNGSAESQSPLKGEFRMQSDYAIARDPRTACEWQALASNEALMRHRFRAAMAKMATLGQVRSALTDCSDIIPAAVPLRNGPYLPAGKHISDIQASCKGTPFPNLPTAPGPAPSIPAV